MYRKETFYSLLGTILFQIFPTLVCQYHSLFLDLICPPIKQLINSMCVFSKQFIKHEWNWFIQNSCGSLNFVTHILSVLTYSNWASESWIKLNHCDKLSKGQGVPANNLWSVDFILSMQVTTPVCTKRFTTTSKVCNQYKPFLTMTIASTLRLLSTMQPRTDFLRLSPDLRGRKHEWPLLSKRRTRTFVSTPCFMGNPCLSLPPAILRTYPWSWNKLIKYYMYCHSSRKTSSPETLASKMLAGPMKIPDTVIYWLCYEGNIQNFAIQTTCLKSFLERLWTEAVLLIYNNLYCKSLFQNVPICLHCFYTR